MASPVLVKDDTEYSDLNAITVKDISTGLISHIPHASMVSFTGREEILSWGNPETYQVGRYSGKAAAKYPAIIPPRTHSMLQHVFQGKDLSKSDLTALDPKLSKLDSLENFFEGCTVKPNQLDHLDVSEVKNFSGCFRRVIGTLDLSKWDMSSAEDISYMFESYGGGYFGLIGDWDVSNVTNMDGLFKNCQWIEHNDLSKWNVSKITVMPKEFDDGAIFWVGERPHFKIADPNRPGPDYLTYETGTGERKYVKLGDEFPAKDIFKVIDWGESDTFRTPKGYLSLPKANEVPPLLPSWVTNLSGTFKGATVPANIGTWDVTNFTDLSDCFSNARLMDYIKLDTWDVSKVTDFTNMFAGATVKNPNIGSWDVGSAEKMDGMFNGVRLFNEDLSGWDVSRFEEKPTDFDKGATSWILPKPNWKVKEEPVDPPEEKPVDPEVPPIDPEVPEIDPPEVPEVDPPVDPTEPLRVGMIRCLDASGKIVDVTITKGVVIIPDGVRVVLDWGYVTSDYLESLK